MQKNELLAIQIYACIVRHKIDDGCIVWTDFMLAEILNRRFEPVEAARIWLTKKEYMTAFRGEFRTTRKGDEWFAEAIADPKINWGDKQTKWKNEALTGMIEKRCKESKLMVSERSDITNGALPKSKPLKEYHPTPEDALLNEEDLEEENKRLARYLGILDMQIYYKMRAQGRIKICPGHDAIPHPGVFDKKGKYWHSLCRDCRREARR